MGSTADDKLDNALQCLNWLLGSYKIKTYFGDWGNRAESSISVETYEKFVERLNELNNQPKEQG